MATTASASTGLPSAEHAPPAPRGLGRLRRRAARPLSEPGDLSLAGLSKWYGSTLAVDGIDLVAAQGRYVALLGPSGCGKTSTLRMVAGFEQPSDGRIMLGDTDLTELRPNERPVNTVFQSYALFPHLDVLGNVMFGPRRRGVRDASARARQALDLVELGSMARRRPSELSGGEQQRVALARALVNDPAVLLLDEPLGALDLRLRRAMQDSLKALQRRLGTTFLHVTHDQEEALTLADDVAVMRAGTVEQFGSPQQVYELPQTAFVATFLGRAILAVGAVVGTRGTGEGASVDYRLGAAGVVTVPRARISAAGEHALVGIRPEKVRVLTDDGAPSAVHSGEKVDVLGPGRVIAATFTGAGTAYEVDVHGLGPVQVTVTNDGRTRAFAPGETVRLAFAAAHAFAVPVPDGGVPVTDSGDAGVSEADVLDQALQVDTSGWGDDTPLAGDDGHQESAR
ncbi:MAG: ABC transporter ATP-binding protein [Dermatophilus congolensis]|nr:ABC transporter ATP-binding protein [Dermatophilus congolensis]